jgi:hypothetical protein
VRTPLFFYMSHLDHEPGRDCVHPTNGCVSHAQQIVAPRQIQ